MGRNLSTFDYGVIIVASWILYKGTSQLAQYIRRTVRTTKLKGPKSQSFLFGVGLQAAGDAALLFEEWANEYGSVFQAPSALGSRNIVVCDPKAAAHFYAHETYTYRQPNFLREFTATLIGKGIMYVEADDHKRQRKAMNPAFSVAAVRNYTQVFYDCSYKVKTIWDTIFESSLTDDIVVDVEAWVNRISLDSIGLAGFSHDFETLSEKSNAVIEAFDTIGKTPRSKWFSLIFILSPLLPILQQLPSKRKEVLDRYRTTIGGIAEALLERIRREKKVLGDDKGVVNGSIIGTMVDAEIGKGKASMSEEEVQSQMLTMILAGYESTSTVITWALIHLAIDPEKQKLLRKELLDFQGDPTFDQLNSNFPYLEAVFRESLRLHPPVINTIRTAHTDDVMPLSEPLMTASGKLVDSINIAKGETIVVSIKALNIMQSVWGSDAKKFVPERWLNEDGIPAKAKEMPGYHHVLSFVDGARVCIGRTFAMAEFKAVLSVLIKNYEFSLRDGPDSEFEVVTVILPRPKLKGEQDISVPLRVRRIGVDTS